VQVQLLAQLLEQLQEQVRCLFELSYCSLILSICIVLGPIGTLAGAAIGGAIGGIVGAGGGKKVAEKQQSQIDQELFYHDIAHRWQPDEEVKNCRNCNKEFSAIRRKHHCRYD